MARPEPHCKVTGGGTKRESGPGVLFLLKSNVRYLGFHGFTLY